MAKLHLLAALCCALASVGAMPAPGSAQGHGLSVGRRIASAEHGAMLRRAEEEEEDPNKIDQTGEFDTEIALQGGDVQQDTTFPPGQNGVLEIEFANAEGRTLVVSENKTPGAPPAGFVPLEASSFKVNLSGGSADNLTVSKVDYIGDVNNGLDISAGQVGRLCAETNTFVVGPQIGELEFEAEENEISLKVANMNGEFGIFIPDPAAGAAGGGGGGGAAAGAGGAAAGAGGGTLTGGGNILDLLTSLLANAGVTLTAARAS